jgi:hypothetical protein
MNVRTVPVLGRSANTGCGRYHLLVLSAATLYNGGDHTTCLVLLQDIFCRRPFNLALRRSRMARFVEVNMGITPRNVRSEGVAPCK